MQKIHINSFWKNPTKIDNNRNENSSDIVFILNNSKLYLLNNIY